MKYSYLMDAHTDSYLNKHCQYLPLKEKDQQEHLIELEALDRARSFRGALLDKVGV